MENYKPKRLIYFDLMRLILVLAALVSHYLTAQKFSVILAHDTVTVIKIFTRASMPGLLIIFGFMLEYIYVQRLQKWGAQIVLTKMTARALLCYLAFISLSLLGVLVGVNTLKSFIGSLFFLSGALHANLFKYYAILFPIVFMLMIIKYRYGWFVKIITIAGLVLCAEILNELINNFKLGYFAHLSSLLFGFRDVWGPSIVHSLLFVVFGQLVASFSINGKKSLLFIILIIFVCSVICLVFEMLDLGLYNFLENISSYKVYRATNSYIYSAYGIFMFTIIWWVLLSINELIGKNLSKFITRYGGNTFILFYWGNFLLLLMPTLDYSLSIKIAFLMLVLVVSLLIVDLVNSMLNKVQSLKQINDGIYRFGEYLVRGLASSKFLKDDKLVINEKIK